MEDVPFFEAPSDSLKRAGSTRRKTLRKQESLKNMTEFQLRFEVAEVKLLFKFPWSASGKFFFHICWVYKSMSAEILIPHFSLKLLCRAFSKSHLCFCILVITEMLWFIHLISQLTLSLNFLYLWLRITLRICFS